MIRVLFVCLGNICRSPMAEAVFAHKVRDAGLSEHIFVDSAGTGGWHAGEPPHSGTRRLLSRVGIAETGHVGRQLTAADLDEFDYVITMDEENLTNVRRIGRGRATVAPLMSFATEAGGITEVPDPYYSGAFDEVYQLVDMACDGLLETIRRQKGL